MSNNLRVIVVAVIVVIIAIAITLKSSKVRSDLPRVAIANYGPHITLQETIDGIKEQLQNDVEFEIIDVNFEHTLVPQMLQKLKAGKPKVIVTMGTPISQSAKGFIKDIPIVFGCVTNPVEAGLLTLPNKAKANITGVSDQQDLNVFISFAKKLLPRAKNIGVLYSTSDANDASLVKMLQEAAKLYNMEVVAVSIEHARDIPLRMHLFNGKVDLIYVGVSGPIQPSLPAIVAEADHMNIPVFNVNEEAVLKHYVVGSFGVNYRKLGYHIAAIIKRILHGEQIKDLDPVYPDLADFKGFISQKRAIQFGINLPPDLDNITIVE